MFQPTSPAAAESWPRPWPPPTLPGGLRGPGRPAPRAAVAAKTGRHSLPDAVLAVLNRANAAQIKAMRAEPIPVSTGGAVREMSSNWVSATYYVGAARLARVTNDVDTLIFLSEAAEHFNYGLRGSRRPSSC
jgi:hypothetical protein